MKKLIYLFVAILMFSSCKKSNYVPKFDEPAEIRVGKQIALVREALTAAPNGWIATLPTGARGGYGFHMSFDDKEVLTSYADLTDVSSRKEIVSTYRIKQDAGIDLVFDTYTYLTWLNDPDPSTYGGAAKTGFSSDVDFIFKRISGDSILFTGKRYRQTLILVKATAAEKISYQTGGYKAAIDKLKAFLEDNQNPYIEVGTLKAGLSLGNITKLINLTGEKPDGIVDSQTGVFAYTLYGADILAGGFSYEGVTFVKLGWKDANTPALYDQAGKEYLVKNSALPLLTLDQLWGSKFTGIYSDYKTINPGTTTAGADILNYFYNNLTVPAVIGIGATFNYGDLSFVWDVNNKKLNLNAFVSQNNGATGWSTGTIYNYTRDASGVYTFSLSAAPTGGYATNLQSRLHNFILTSKITFDYYLIDGRLLAKMSSVTNPSIVMTFELY